MISVGLFSFDLVSIYPEHIHSKSEPHDPNGAAKNWNFPLCPNMPRNGPKMAKNDPKWPKMVKHDPKWPKMAENEPKWPENGQK